LRVKKAQTADICCLLSLNNTCAQSLPAKSLPICILNGLLVAAFAMGSWQVLHDRLFGQVIMLNVIRIW